MPLDGYDIYIDKSKSTLPIHPQLWDRQPISRQRQRQQQQKRIMMNPPAEFVQAALAANPVTPVSNEIVFDQGGQAVMVPPGGNVVVDDGGDDTPDDAKENEVPGNTPAQTQVQQQSEPMAAAATAPTSTPTPTTAATDSKSVLEMVTTQVMTATATVTPSSAVTPTSESNDSQTDPAQTNTLAADNSSSDSNASPTSTLPAVRMSSSAPTISSSSSSTSTSASSANSSSPTSSSASSAPPKPFTQTAPFIFLMVLGSLVIVAVAATLFSTCFRWRDSCGCLPCCRPERDDEEDGLSDLVRSFDLERTSTAGLSRASSMRRPPPMMDARQMSLQQRSNLFANSPSQAGFLHTTSGVEGSIFESEDEKTMTDHLYGGAGPLEIKNAVEGDIPGENESTHAGIGPRHLGVEGKSLFCLLSHRLCE